MKIKSGYGFFVVALLNMIWYVNFAVGLVFLSYYIGMYDPLNEQYMIGLGGIIFGTILTFSAFSLDRLPYNWGNAFAYWKTEKVLIDEPVRTKWFKTPILSARFRE